MRAFGAVRSLWIAALLVTASVAAAAPSAQPLSGMALWQRAVEIAGKNASLLPAQVYVKVVIADGSDNIKSSTETWSRVAVDGDGALVTTVIRSIKDGADNTANAQKETARNPGRSRFEYSFLPMMPENQDKVEVAPNGRKRVVDGVSCDGFTFRMTGDKNQVTTGTVWVDPADGSARLMDFTFDPLPTGAKEVRNELRFEATPDGGWHLASLSTYGAGQFLFLQRVFRLQMSFSDYFAYTPPQRVSGSTQ